MVSKVFGAETFDSSRGTVDQENPLSDSLRVRHSNGESTGPEELECLIGLGFRVLTF